MTERRKRRKMVCCFGCHTLPADNPFHSCKKKPSDRIEEIRNENFGKDIHLSADPIFATLYATIQYLDETYDL